MNDYYFAAVPTEDIAEELQKKVDDYYRFLTSSNLAELWRRSYRAYYGMRQNLVGSGWGVFDVGALHPSGAQGEIVRIKINHFANLITHQLSLTMGNRPALECRATNADQKSLIAASLGDGLTEYYLREQKLEQNYFEAIESGLVMSEGYVIYDWDVHGGQQYGKGAGGEKLYNGEIKADNYGPFDVIKDITKKSAKVLDWNIFRDRQNRWDLIQRYAKDKPQLADRIRALKSDQGISDGKTGYDPSKMIALSNIGELDTDDVSVFQFRHKRTDSMPNGRLTIFLNGDTKLFDGPLPFESLEIYRFAPRNVLGTPFGWTLAFDILAIQELVDKLYTVVSSNCLAGGMTRFWLPPNSGLNTVKLSDSFGILESIVEPKILELLKTPAEVYNFINKLESVMEVLSGTPKINRGEVPTNDMSGTAMAFASSQAITFGSSVELGSNNLLESMGNGLISFLKRFGNRPRMAAIVGIQNRSQLKSFSGADLEPINNVVCEQVSAMSKTLAGRITIADKLLDSGKIQTGQEYMTLVKTGQMEPMTRSTLMQNFTIQQENEQLLEGKLPVALRYDKHAQHIAEHVTVLDSPEARQNADLISLVDQHVREHERLAMQMQMEDPAFLAATGQQPLPFPAQQPPPGAAGQPPGPPPPQSAPHGGPGIGAALNPASPVQQKAAQVRPPAPPKLPNGTDPQTAQNFEKLQAMKGQ